MEKYKHMSFEEFFPNPTPHNIIENVRAKTAREAEGNPLSGVEEQIEQGQIWGIIGSQVVGAEKDPDCYTQRE
ncbi:hypothetical protein HYW76_04765 [Candidatus Pacearchaeota archaeon]|nr:hypothetical protein [Candidatus Pacearchaeota archaeon]